MNTNNNNKRISFIDFQKTFLMESESVDFSPEREKELKDYIEKNQDIFENIDSTFSRASKAIETINTKEEKTEDDFERRNKLFTILDACKFLYKQIAKNNTREYRLRYYLKTHPEISKNPEKAINDAKAKYKELLNKPVEQKTNIDYQNENELRTIIDAAKLILGYKQQSSFDKKTKKLSQQDNKTFDYPNISKTLDSMEKEEHKWPKDSIVYKALQSYYHHLAELERINLPEVSNNALSEEDKKIMSLYANPETRREALRLIAKQSTELYDQLPKDIHYSSSYRAKKDLETKIKKEQEKLPEIIKDINAAKEQGDLSENFEYESAMKEKDKAEKEIDRISEQINNNEFEEVRPYTKIPNEVSIHTAVTITNQFNRTKTYYIAGPLDSGVDRNIIPCDGEMAKALLYNKKGSVISIPTSLGMNMRARIDEIENLPQNIIDYLNVKSDA